MMRSWLVGGLAGIVLVLGVVGQGNCAEVRRLVLVTGGEPVTGSKTVTGSKSVTGSKLVMGIDPVTGSKTPIPLFSAKEVRRIFLGAHVEKLGKTWMPLINTSDPLVHQVFLQKVIFMSAAKYKRQLLSRVFRFGGKRPPFYTRQGDLIRALLNQSGTVSYMWLARAVETPGLTVVKELWRGALE